MLVYPTSLSSIKLGTFLLHTFELHCAHILKKKKTINSRITLTLFNNLIHVNFMCASHKHIKIAYEKTLTRYPDDILSCSLTDSQYILISFHKYYRDTEVYP